MDLDTVNIMILANYIIAVLNVESNLENVSPITMSEGFRLANDPS